VLAREVFLNWSLRVIGYLARHYLPGGRIRLARFLVRHFAGREVDYVDQWGYTRTARLPEEMEALGFVGFRPLSSDHCRYIRPGDWVIDVGANVGLVTAELCKLVGPDGRVWAIEPLPENVARLQAFKVLNHLTSLHIIEGALSDCSGNASLGLPRGGGSAHASITKSWDTAGSVKISTWRLDDLAFKAPPRTLSFIKIDVEGFEPQVLEGARRTLSEMRPVVLCEFNDVLLQDAGSSSKELLRRFEDLGYAPKDKGPQLDGLVMDLLLLPT